MRGVKIKIYGRVQGVCFRINLAEQAEKLGLRGWVRNLDDGSVEAEVYGRGQDLNKLIDWCYNGPKLARVSQVKSNFFEAGPGEEIAKDFFIKR